ncbi:MAG: ATP-dependent DNA helicase RecG [candidate division FCPU426 bacterium]
MKPNQEAVRWLLKPLELEQRLGFLDTAVAGGMKRWLPQVRDKLMAQAGLTAAEAGRLLEGLEAYAEARSDQRERLVAEVWSRLAGPKAPEPKATPAAAPAAPARPIVPLRRSDKCESPAAGMSPPAMRKAHGRSGTPAPSVAGGFQWQDPVQYIKGVGPQRAKLFANLGVHTAEDLLRHYPRDWQDRRSPAKIAILRHGQTALVDGRVKARQTFTVRRGLKITKVVLEDGTGHIAATWFNQPYLMERFQNGQRVLAYGKVEFHRSWQVLNPDYEILEDETEESIHTGRIVPIYPLTERLSQRVVRSLVHALVGQIPDDWPDPLPPALTAEKSFAPAAQALRSIHFPPDQDSLARARARLVFEELFLQQIAVVRLKRRYQHQHSQPLQVNGPLAARFRQNLPFALTTAQERATQEICRDLGLARPMHRLLQGDVGSGKTIVAALAMLAAADSGRQAALMAPTEILAGQHYLNLKPLLEPLGLRLELFTSGLPAKAKAGLRADLASGRIHLAVGTHALTQAGVEFSDLGLAVVDEQHRFGVEQRSLLRAKGEHPHVLVMTATPIPRTLALTVYGDLDVSVLDELPPGRIPVHTEWLRRSAGRKAYEQLAQAVAAGQQGFVVFPAIEESEKLDLKALATEYQRLERVFPDCRLGLLHGRLPTPDKERIMAEFAAGRTQILAATTVVEVGVDIPNATVMIIENAERFGLASLHQLRGRVGRSSKPAQCFLIGEPTTEEGKRRLEVMSQVRDGFKLAEEDLALRGPGEFFGLRQHGLPDLKLAHLIRDADQIEAARQAAGGILEADPELSRPEHAALRRIYASLYLEKEQRALAG